MVSESKELKTCPRCRRRYAKLAEEKFIKLIPLYVVKCPKCNTRTKCYLLKAHAVNAWNDRSLAFDARKAVSVKAGE